MMDCTKARHEQCSNSVVKEIYYAAVYLLVLALYTPFD
jgi:hypothetical protein